MLAAPGCEGTSSWSVPNRFPHDSSMKTLMEAMSHVKITYKNDNSASKYRQGTQRYLSIFMILILTTPPTKIGSNNALTVGNIFFHQNKWTRKKNSVE